MIEKEKHKKTIEYFYSKNGSKEGPCSESEIQIMLSEGEIAPDDHCWYEGADDWMLIHDEFTIPQEILLKWAKSTHSDQHSAGDKLKALVVSAKDSYESVISPAVHAAGDKLSETASEFKEKAAPRIKDMSAAAGSVAVESGKKAGKVAADVGKISVDYAKEHTPDSVKGTHENFMLFFKRSSATRASSSIPTEKETKVLDEAEILDHQTRSLLIWRRSMLYVGACMIFLTVLAKLPDLFNLLENDDKLPLIIMIIDVIPLLLVLFAAFKTYQGYRHWTDTKKTRNFTIAAGAALIFQNAVYGIVPLSPILQKMIMVEADPNHLWEADQVQLFDQTFRIPLGLFATVIFILSFSPSLFGSAFGFLRGCLAGRIFSKSATSGVMLLVAAGLAFLMMFFLFGLAVQMTGSMLLSLGMLFLLMLLANYVKVGLKLAKDLDDAAVIAIVSRLEKTNRILFGLATLLSVYGCYAFIGDYVKLSEHWDMVKDYVSGWGMVKLIFSSLATYCIMTVAFTDFVLSIGDDEDKESL